MPALPGLCARQRLGAQALGAVVQHAQDGHKGKTFRPTCLPPSCPSLETPSAELLLSSAVRTALPVDTEVAGRCQSGAYWVQGPSAVTLETLTLAHFLDRAVQLAASAQEIKALDAQVRILHNSS